MNENQGASPPRRARTAVRVLLALVAGLALALSFPKPGAWFLAVPALGVFFALWATATPGRAFLEGFVGGVVFFGVLSRWFAYTLESFTSMGVLVAWGAPLLAGILDGLSTAVVSWTTARWRARGGRRLALVVAPVLWVGFEVYREQYPFPYPWGTLAAVWTPAPGAAAATAVLGAYGLSLILALGAALLAAVFVGRRSVALLGIGVWIGLLLGLAAGGRWLAARAPAGTPVRVAVVQGAAWRDNPFAQFAVYERLTVEAAGAGARLVVWPESCTPFRADTDPDYRRRLEGLASRLDIDLVLGSITSAPGNGLYNSAVLIRGDTGFAGVQAKRRLVPFGEYMPLRWLVGKVPALATELGQDFQRGPAPVVLHSRFGAVGALVCYEALYPQLVDDLTKGGADILVNITNDSWYGATSGPWQHLEHALPRAPETGRPLVRAANSGVSVLVDREGRMVKKLGLGERGFLLADLQRGTGTTPGALLGGWARKGCAIFALAALIAAFFLRGGRKPPRGPAG